MKSIGIISAAATAVCLLSGCSKTPQQETSSIAEATPAPAASAPATPQPSGAAAPAAPAVEPASASAPTAIATPAPELAPAGVLYLVEAVRIETDSGITSLTPGTGVKLLHDDVYLTPAGEAHLRPDQMTNNMTLARQILTADRQAQAAIKATGAAQAESVATLQALRSAEAATTQNAAMEAQNAEALKARISALTIERQALEAKISILQRKQSGENYRAIANGHIIASTTVQESKALIDRRAAVDRELAELQRRR
jgi:hypothetical protein